MKFTDNFISGLKNFSYISPEIYFVEGTTQTIVKNLSLFASLKSDVNIDKPFAILSLPKFLGVLSSFNEPDIEVNDRFLKISSGSKVVHYQLTNPDFIKYEKNPSKFEKMQEDISFTMKYDDYSSIMKLSGLLSSEELQFVGNGSTVNLLTTNSNENGDSAKIQLDATNQEFKVVIKSDNLKLMPTDYLVRITRKGAINFRSDTIEYYMPVEKDKSNL